MFQQGKNIRSFIDKIREVYRDHPRMRSVDSLKAQLKQEKLQDKIFWQSIKGEKSSSRKPVTNTSKSFQKSSSSN